MEFIHKRDSKFRLEKIFGKSTIKSQLFFQAIEHSEFTEISYYYLQIYKHGTVLAIVPCFCYELDFLNLTTSSTTKKLIGSIRKIYSGFFKIKAFVTGTYAASCEHFIEYARDISQMDKKLVAQLVNLQLKNKKQRNRIEVHIHKRYQGTGYRPCETSIKR